MTSPTERTIKRLFALSRNRCAYPKCGTPIVHESGAITGDVCHIKAASPGGPRFDPGQTDTERHAFENLVLMCKVHHQVVDRNPVRFTVDLLKDMKDIQERDGDIELSMEAARMAVKLKEATDIILHAGRDAQVMVGSPGGIQAQHVGQVIIKTGKRRVPSAIPTSGGIGHNLAKRNYILHLIERYNDFQKWDQTKQGVGKYITIHKAIKREFGSKWDFIDEVEFPRLSAFLQGKIRGSKLGRIMNSRGQKCFSTWEEWLRDHHAGT